MLSPLWILYPHESISWPGRCAFLITSFSSPSRPSHIGLYIIVYQFDCPRLGSLYRCFICFGLSLQIDLYGVDLLMFDIMWLAPAKSIGRYIPPSNFFFWSFSTTLFFVTPWHASSIYTLYAFVMGKHFVIWNVYLFLNEKSEFRPFACPIRNGVDDEAKTNILKWIYWNHFRFLIFVT